jgi:hypothetical protein
VRARRLEGGLKLDSIWKDFRFQDVYGTDMESHL